MTRSTGVGPALTSPILLLTLCVLPACCLADYSVGDISREQAKALGITVHTLPYVNHDLRVQVDFNATGRMKEFRWADLELRQGGKRLVTAAIQPREPAQDSPSESKRLEFYIDPAALSSASVTLFVADAVPGGTGYRLQMKEFAVNSAAR